MLFYPLLDLLTLFIFCIRLFQIKLQKVANTCILVLMPFYWQTLSRNKTMLCSCKAFLTKELKWIGLVIPKQHNLQLWRTFKFTSIQYRRKIIFIKDVYCINIWNKHLRDFRWGRNETVRLVSLCHSVCLPLTLDYWNSTEQLFVIRMFFDWKHS